MHLTGAVVPDGGSQVWQAPCLAHGRLQCVKKGAGTAVPGGSFSVHMLCTACRSCNLCPAGTRHGLHEFRHHVGLANFHALSIRRAAGAWLHCKGQAYSRHMQALLRMSRPPSLSQNAPVEPPNPFTAQQNPFQPATPFGQVWETSLAAISLGDNPHLMPPGWAGYTATPSPGTHCVLPHWFLI